MIAESSLQWRLEGKYNAGVEKVTAVVPVLWKKTRSRSWQETAVQKFAT